MGLFQVLVQYEEESRKLSATREICRKSMLEMLNRHTLESERPVTLLEVEIHFEAINHRVWPATPSLQYLKNAIPHSFVTLA